MLLNTLKNNNIVRDLSILVALLALVPIFTNGYYTHLIGSAIIFAIFAISLDLAWGYAGILSLGHSVFFGIGSYTYAILSSSGDVLIPPIIAAVIGIIVPAVLALVVGWFIFYIKSTPFYIGVVTLSLTLVFSQLVLYFRDLTGGQNGLTNISGLPFTDTPLYYFLLTLLVLVLVITYKLIGSKLGNLIISIRDNEERAQFLGFNTPFVRSLVLVISAAIAGFAGVLYAPYDGFVSPSLISFGLATQVVIWVAVGGKGKIVGAVIGALLINILSPIFNSNFPQIWQIFLGLMFIIAVVLVPDGLYSFINKNSRQQKKSFNFIPRTRNDVVELNKKEIMKIEDLKVSFGSLDVLKGLNLVFRSGEIQCVIGPNGAGKSTFINAITGRNKLTSGKVYFHDQIINNWKPERIVQSNIARTFQSTNIVESLTVAENIQLATSKGRLSSLMKQSETLQVSPIIIELLKETGLDQLLNEVTGNLSHGQQQALELCMVIALSPKVMFLDEPTAGLTKIERTNIGNLLRKLSHEQGVSILIIEHDIEFVKEIADRVTVLHDGKLAADGSVSEVTSSNLVKEIYLGGH